MIMEQSDEIELFAYRNNIFGTITFCVMHTFSVMTFVYYFILMFDIYHGCQLKTIDSPRLYGHFPLFSYKLNSKIFTGLWFFFITWFSFQLKFKRHFRNWCRVPCSYDKAECVLV